MTLEPSRREPAARRAGKQEPDARWLLATVATLVAIDVLPFVIVALPGVPDIAATGSLSRALTWFDPLFFGYNVALLLTAQLIVPFVTYMYVIRMKHEKERRLRRDVPDQVWRDNEHEIRALLDGHFRFHSYLGSMGILLVIITLGGSIILLMKPGANGVDFARGANFLMAGPLAELDPANAQFYHRVITSLVAFQFGFLGGFIYFIGQLVRGYFTLDLSPHTYVDSAVRMAVASVLSLVVSFVLPLEASCTAHADLWRCVFHPLPVVSFFLGYFPSRGLLFIEKYAAQQLGQKVGEYNGTSLSVLQGMSFAHEVRLDREGFDNVENLSHADTLDLAVRTGFSYRQLRHWIGQAWLRTHLGRDYQAFFDTTGLSSRHEVEQVVEAVAQHTDGLVMDPLIDAGATVPRPKLETLKMLLARREPHRRSPAAEAYSAGSS
jgi:hypothetical protein